MYALNTHIPIFVTYISCISPETERTLRFEIFNLSVGTLD